MYLGFILCSSRTILTKVSMTIMLDPFGDSKHTGKEIDDTFERGITMQCAEELKKQLNALFPDLRVVITRVPGESIHPLQNASFSNRLQADFHLCISFYHQEMPTYIAFFYYLENSTDHWHKYNPLCFYHVQQAHLINLKSTKIIGEKFLKIFQDSSINSAFTPLGLFGCPYKQLIGIQAPSLAIEVGLLKKDDWKYLMNPLITCIKELIS